MNADRGWPNPNPYGTQAERRLQKVILRLVKGGPERLAIEAGQIDAIVDPASGTALLLPEAQRVLMERPRRVTFTDIESSHPSISSGKPVVDHKDPLENDPGVATHLTEHRAAAAQDHLVRIMLDALAVQVCVVDSSGGILSANKAWSACAAKYTCIGAGVAEGGNYLEACDAADSNERMDGIAIAAGIRQVIAGSRELFRYEHACDKAPFRGSPDRERDWLTGPCWLMLTITRIAGDGPARAVVLREDITERKQGELLLALEQTVARCLATAVTTTAALKAVIRAICETQDWDYGRYYQLDPTTDVLRLNECWGVSPATVASGAGWDDAYVFPVMSEDMTIGLLAFSGHSNRESNDRIRQTALSIGYQLGRFLHQQQASSALRRSEARFRKLTEVSSDWYWEQDHDFRFTKYTGHGVQSASEVLGKTRWELPNIVLSDGEWAEHRRLLIERGSFRDFRFTAILGEGKLGYYSVSGDPVYDDDGMFSGYCGTGRNITQFTEIALRETEALLRAAAGLPPD